MPARPLIAAALALTLLLPALPGRAEENVLKLGFAGLLDRKNREDLPPITLGSGKPLADAPYELRSGGYYRIRIVSDGSAELAVAGPEFFRNIWVNEVVINDIEVRPMGLSSLEFDDEGEAEISFIAIVPGQYTLGIPGARGDSQLAHFTIR
ncbi:hypothetical protein FDP22_18655 (plasmid) [Paroceanicella profunda]|uniref:MSP domain-containing protein n=1 Tax=Paroceanicella profunda TaxID=2579971 RepID=A0A5B8G3P2_9RHOB|nr:hypothetical protein [Paroceanicella profunda]QDL93902.1 hypothetical protein FDP22_18655 [Paroceanicella profunda]